MFSREFCIAVFSILNNPSSKVWHRLVWFYFCVAEVVEELMIKVKFIPRPKKENFINSQPLHSQIKNLSKDHRSVDDKTIEIVNYEAKFGKSGILTKISTGLTSEFRLKGTRVVQTSIPSGKSDFTLHIFFRFCIPIEDTTNIALVTHIDTRMKMKRVAWLISNNVHLLCLSAETKNQIDFQYPNRNTHVVIKAINPPPQVSYNLRKLKVGYFTNIYKDGRKREDIIKKIIPLLDSQFVYFYLMGAGLSSLAKRLRDSSFSINYLPEFNLNFYKESLSQLDLLIYTGLDEGAISVIDAIHSGVPVAITRVGYHLDIPDHPGIMFFNEPKDLAALINERSQIHSQLAKILPIRNYADFGDLLLEYLLEIEVG